MYPFTGQYFVRDGLQMHYLDEGSGEPVLMLHGNPSWSFYYRNLALALRKTHRVIVPDHIGCGLSDKPSDKEYHYTLDQRVLDLEELLDSLGIDSDLTLIVHDWGGMIGMTYAVRHPETIKRLVILNTGAFRLPSEKPLPWQLKLCRTRVLGPLLVRGLNLFARGTARMGCTRQSMDPKVRKGYLAPYDSWKHRRAVLRFVQDIPLESSDSAYDTVVAVESGLAKLRDKPMMICWGDKDFVFDHHFLNEWKRRFPDAEVHRFPDASHYVLEDAAEDVIPLIVNFCETAVSTNSSASKTQ